MGESWDAGALESWLKEKPWEFACVLAARAALRAVPVLRHALHEQAEERRDAVILPTFRALAAASFAGTWPARTAGIRSAARDAVRDAEYAVAEIGNVVRMSEFEAKDAIPEMHEYIWRLEGDARAFGIGERAVEAATHAAQAAVDAVDAAKGIASPDAVFESCVAAAAAACDSIDGLHGYTELFAGSRGEGEAPAAAHIVEFWQAGRSDAEFLEAGAGGRGEAEETAARLSGCALWREGMPVWVGRGWANFKENLPESDGWSDWVDWYEGRLTGCGVDAATEFERVTGSKAKREQASSGDGEPDGDATHDQQGSAAGSVDSAHEATEQERRYYTDDELRSYITASQLMRLSRREQIVHMVSWFRRMYEDPINETPYDSEEKDYVYVWGGPFNARDELADEFGDLIPDEVIQAAVSEVESDGTVDWAPTSSNPKNTGGRDDEEEDDGELILPTLAEIRERLSSGVTPRFGAADEVEGREALRNEIAELREILESMPPPRAGIGHNQPPEPLTLSVELKADVTIAIGEMDRELAKASPDVDVVVERSGVLAKALAWVAQKADKFVDAMVRAAGAGIVADMAGIPVWETIARVYESALRWLDVVMPLF